MADHGHGHNHDQDMDLLEGMGYEPRDMDLSGKTVGLNVIALVVFIVASFVIAWWFLVLYGRTTGFFREPGQPVNVARRQLPPEVPRLQSNTTAKLDMVKLRTEEAAKLNAVEWTDTSKTHARIPVENAIEILAHRGLPTRSGAKVPADYKDRASAHAPKAPMHPPTDLASMTGKPAAEKHESEEHETEESHEEGHE